MRLRLEKRQYRDLIRSADFVSNFERIANYAQFRYDRSIYLSIYPSIDLFTYLSVRVHVRVCIHVCVCVSESLTILPSTHGLYSAGRRYPCSATPERGGCLPFDVCLGSGPSVCADSTRPGY